MTGWWARAREALLDPAPDVEAELDARFFGPLAVIPRTRGDVYDTYGNPGVGKVDPKWERGNMVSARNLPGRWNKGSGKLYIHRLAEPYLREALRRAGLFQEFNCIALRPLGYITRLGCFAFRHQRHDPARPLSYHSWGIAVDINSEDNEGKYIKHPIECWSEGWQQLWPAGVPRELVRAFESVGWRWGGRWRGKDGFIDPMHFELVA